jgi:hypothetical protein
MYFKVKNYIAFDKGTQNIIAEYLVLSMYLAESYVRNAMLHLQKPLI